MKHLSTLVVVLGVVAVVAAPTEDNKKPEGAKATAPAKTVVKKETNAEVQKPAPAKTSVKKEAKAEEKGVPKLMGATIVAVDGAKKIITVRFKSNNFSFSVTPQTALVAKDNKISFPDLKKGDRVTVNYLKFKNGERKAEKINNKTFAAKLAKIKSKPEPQAKPAQAKKVKNQPKTQQAPAQKKAVQAKPAPEAKTIQKEEAKSEEKKETTKAAK